MGLNLGHLQKDAHGHGEHGKRLLRGHLGRGLRSPSPPGASEVDYKPPTNPWIHPSTMENGERTRGPMVNHNGLYPFLTIDGWSC